jgi:hypothetical protein
VPAQDASLAFSCSADPCSWSARLAPGSSPARSWPPVAARFLRDPPSAADAFPVHPAAASFAFLDLRSLSSRAGFDPLQQKCDRDRLGVPSVSFFDLAGVIYILVLWDLLKSAVLIGSLILKPSISRLRVFFCLIVLL